MKADFNPGDRAVFHTHRFPVAACILGGAFTLRGTREALHRVIFPVGRSRYAVSGSDSLERVLDRRIKMRSMSKMSKE